MKEFNLEQAKAGQPVFYIPYEREFESERNEEMVRKHCPELFFDYPIKCAKFLGMEGECVRVMLTDEMLIGDYAEHFKMA